MKRLSITAFLTFLLLVTIILMYQNKAIVSNANIFPFEMPSKSFKLQVLNYTGVLFEYKGAKYLNLSMAYGSHPMGIIYDSKKNTVYIALHPEGIDAIFGIVEVDVTTKNLKIYRFPWQIDDNYYGPMPWTIAVDKDDNLWISIRYYCVRPNNPPDTIPYLAKLETETANLTIYYIPNEMDRGLDIKYYADYVWYMTINGLSKISLDGIIQEYYPRYFADGCMKPDLDCIWISSVTEGFITRFNITAKLFDVNITGLTRPLGIEVDEKYVYVAENSQVKGPNGTIAVIDKETFTITQRKRTAKITIEGPYYVLKDKDGNLWWTDNSQHFGYFNTTNNLIIYESISLWCYFMTETPNTIWFSVKGSAYVGLVTTHQTVSSGVTGSCGRKPLLK